MKKISPALYRFRKLRWKALSDVKKFFFAIDVTAIFLFSGCQWFAPMEMHKTEAGRTTFRSAEETPAESEVTPAPQKIPGERR